MKTQKLSDKERVEIRAAHAQGGISYKSLAEKYHVSPKTIERVVRNDPEDMAQKVDDIKKQNAVDVTEHIKSRSGFAMNLFDDILGELRKKLSKASTRELFGGLKIISEIFSPKAEGTGATGADPVNVQILFGNTSGNTSNASNASDTSTDEEATHYAN